jgi:hypothetical protein
MVVGVIDGSWLCWEYKAVGDIGKRNDIIEPEST